MAGLMDYVQQTFGLEPNIQRPSVLPLPERAAGGNLDWSQWTAPQWLYDAARAVSAPAYAAQGGQLSMDDAYNMAVNVAGGGLMGSAPKRVAGGLMGAAQPAELGIFAGTGAKTADLAALAKAQKMAEGGAGRDAIWADTGWFQGVDGKWRFEIDDSGTKLDPSAIPQMPDAGQAAFSRVMELYGVDAETALRLMDDDPSIARNAMAWAKSRRDGPPPSELSSALTHDQLFTAYPDAAQIKIVGDKIGDAGASYLDAEDLITLGRDQNIALAGKYEPKSSVLHEVQHAVDAREGFTPGANPREYADAQSIHQMAHDNLAVLNKRTGWAKTFAEWVKSKGGMANTTEAERSAFRDKFFASQDEGIFREYQRTMSQIDYGEQQLSDLGVTDSKYWMSPRELYNNTAGEVSARNVQTRRDMTAAQRRGTPPWQTQDVPDAEQIIRYLRGP